MQMVDGSMTFWCAAVTDASTDSVVAAVFVIW